MKISSTPTIVAVINAVINAVIARFLVDLLMDVAYGNKVMSTVAGIAVGLAVTGYMAGLLPYRSMSTEYGPAFRVTRPQRRRTRSRRPRLHCPCEGVRTGELASARGRAGHRTRTRGHGSGAGFPSWRMSVPVGMAARGRRSGGPERGATCCPARVGIE